MLISCKAWLLPYQALSLSTWIPTPISGNSSQGSATHDIAHCGYRTDDQNDKYQGTRPRLPVPVVVRRNGIRKDLERQRGGRLLQPPVPVLVSECREQERRGFPCDSGKGEHHARDDSRGCGAQHDR